MTEQYRLRIILVFLGICGLFGFLGYRFYSIQIAHHTEYSELQQAQFYNKEEIPPKAGMILDRNGKILALSKAVDSVAIIPNILNQNPVSVTTLNQILKIPTKDINDKIKYGLDNHKSFLYLKRRISAPESTALRARKLKGIEIREEYQRVYPNGTLACQLLGSRGLDEKPLGGVELAYSRDLLGETGYRLVPRDAHKHKVIPLDQVEKPPVPGKDIYLTIDTVIQSIAEDELSKACQKWRPVSAEVIVLNPATGEVLALANRPGFDPNTPGKSSPDTERNRAIADPYEPGSVFKPYIACMLLLKGLSHPGETIYCENGAYKFGGRLIHDHEPHGMLTFTNVVAKSSNIGMAKFGMRLGRERMYDTVNLFDFGHSTGLELAGESNGIITPKSRWNDYTTTSVPMGHEIAVTSMQLVKAFSVFANDGVLMKSYLVRQITDSEGKVIVQNQPTVIRQVLDKPTVDKMRRILREVLLSGTATLANIKDYPIAGKTGTAQKINPDGTYSHNKFQSTFVGFAPVDNPRLLVLVNLDEPKGSYYGGVVSAPAVANIIQKSLKYLGVPAQINLAATSDDNE